jgi:hypothetical protein
MVAWDGLILDNTLVFLVVGLAIAGCVAAPLIMLAVMRHQERIKLDHYGKYRGSAPAKSFVCPDCLTRTYAPSHIARRWCSRCDKSFPEAPKVWKPDAQPAE